MENFGSIGRGPDDHRCDREPRRLQPGRRVPQQCLRASRLERGRGPAGRLRLYREDRYLAKANLDWQVDRYDRLRLGGEATRYSIGRYESELAAVGDAYLERPERWNVFVEDRLDLGDVVVIGGLRYDSYASRASRPFLLDTVATSPTFGQYLNIEGAPIYEVGGTFDDRPLVITRPDRSHGYLSPHIQVSFPVSDRTNLRLSYAHQVQPPDFALVLDGVNVGGRGADLAFGKTISFEFGARHAFSDDMVLDMAVYNHDNLALASARTFLVDDPVGQRKSTVVRVTNADFGNAVGVDLRLDRRFGDVFNGTISYTYQRARSTASDPLDIQDRGVAAVNELGGIVSPPPQAIIPTAVSRPHDLAAAFAMAFPPGWRRERPRCRAGQPRSLRHRAFRQRDAVHAVSRARGERGMPARRGTEQCSPSQLQAVRSSADQRLRSRPCGDHRLRRCPERFQLH